MPIRQSKRVTSWRPWDAVGLAAFAVVNEAATTKGK